MKCNKAQILISAHFDGETTSSEWQEVQTHMRGCGDCKILLERFEKSSTLLREGLVEHQPSRDLWEDIAARLEREPAPSQWELLAEHFVAFWDSFVIRPPVPIRMTQLGVAAVMVVLLLIVRHNPTIDLPEDPNANYLSNLNETGIGSGGSILHASTPSGVTQYLEKAGILILEIENSERDPESEEISNFRENSETLLVETLLVKESLRDSDLTDLRDMIEQVELILLEMANIEEERAFEDMEMLKALIVRKDLVIKIEIYNRYEENRKSSQRLQRLQSVKKGEQRI